MESTENTEFFSVPSVVNVTLDYLSPYTEGSASQD